MDGNTNGWMNGKTNVLMDWRMDGQMIEWTEGYLDV